MNETSWKRNGKPSQSTGFRRALTRIYYPSRSSATILIFFFHRKPNSIISVAFNCTFFLLQRCFREIFCLQLELGLNCAFSLAAQKIGKPLLIRCWWIRLITLIEFSRSGLIKIRQFVVVSLCLCDANLPLPSPESDTICALAIEVGNRLARIYSLS